MSSIITLAMSLLLFLAVGLSLTSAGRPGPPPPPPQKGCPNCAGVRCRTPLCADPVTPPGKCCPSCANSQCKFEGCVQLFPIVRWFRDDPCRPCSCVNGVTQCGVIGCPGFPGPDPCFGNPLTPQPASPSECCAHCDFGVPENECQVVPSERRSFSISFGSNICSGQITEHKCDKIGYRENGKLFRCESSSVTRSATIQGCDPFKQLFYEDVGSCTAVEADRTDLSLSEVAGCDLVVPLRRPQGPVGPRPTTKPTSPPRDGNPTRSTTPPGQGQQGQPTSGDPTAPPGPRGYPENF